MVLTFVCQECAILSHKSVELDPDLSLFNPNHCYHDHGLDPRSGIQKKLISDPGSRGKKTPDPGSVPRKIEKKTLETKFI
jgi:hypothetical protein